MQLHGRLKFCIAREFLVYLRLLSLEIRCCMLSLRSPTRIRAQIRRNHIWSCMWFWTLLWKFIISRIRLIWGGRRFLVQQLPCILGWVDRHLLSCKNPKSRCLPYKDQLNDTHLLIVDRTWNSCWIAFFNSSTLSGDLSYCKGTLGATVGWRAKKHDVKCCLHIYSIYYVPSHELIPTNGMRLFSHHTDIIVIWFGYELT